MPQLKHQTPPGVRYEWSLFLTALMFYTRIPVPHSPVFSEKKLNQSRKYFPFIGIIVGSIAVITYVAFKPVLGSLLAVALSMLATILITGAFHEDGFADSCDGLGGGWSAEQVLTIMKDSRLGTYAVVGLTLMLLTRFLALYEAGQHLPLIGFTVMIIVAHTLSRQLSSSVIEYYEYVRDIDSSKIKPITDRRLSAQEQTVSITICALPVIALAFFSPGAAIASLITASTISLLFARYCEKRIGGYTGDTLGATQQLAEITIYLTVLSVAGSS